MLDELKLDTAYFGIAHLGEGLPETDTRAAFRRDSFPLRVIEGVKGIKANFER